MDAEELDFEDDTPQDIARSAYADMLHDIERNEKYEQAIAKVIADFKKKGKEVRVLDIGTGTGLLSMMAARHGADRIHACEAYKPVAACALKVIEENGFSERIKVIPKRSTSLVVGTDLEEKPNLVVAELYDTELIGEGAIWSYNHAKAQLMTEGFVSVPARAKIYAQLVECPLAQMWNRPQRIKTGESQFIVPPPETLNCPGAAAVHDLQMAQLDPSCFKAISEPVEVFQFDWMSPSPTPLREHNRQKITTVAAGTVHAVFFWWSTDMDPDGEIVISCAPPWAHPDGKKHPLPWRDHWMQAIYYVPNDVVVTEVGSELVLDSFHDDYSLWFDLRTEGRPVPDNLLETRPICNCLLHLAYSRMRHGQLNDEERNRKYVTVLKRYLAPGKTVLSLGDGSWLSLIAASLGANVIALEINPLCWQVIQRYAECNELADKLEVVSETIEEFSTRQQNRQIDLVISEPFFEDSVLPWDNLYAWQRVRKIKHLLTDGAKVLPKKMLVKAVGVRFDDLHKIQSPIVKTCGFSMKHFDYLIQGASVSSDENIEPHPLWEYPCTALTSVASILDIEFTLEITSAREVTEVKVPDAAKMNGVVFWCEWYSDDEVVISSGPLKPVKIGEQIAWDIHSKQGCHFFRDLEAVAKCSALKFTVVVNDCDVEINVSLVSV